MPAFPEGTKSTTMTSGGRRKVHYTFPDESEMVDEFDVQTDALVVRKRRSRTLLGGQGEWSFEVGEPSARVTIEGDTLRPSAANPVLVRVDRPHAFEWRIRNLPYPKATYSVSIDHEQRQVVVRTANKKYFKRIDIADLDRARLPLEEAPLYPAECVRSVATRGGVTNASLLVEADEADMGSHHCAVSLLMAPSSGVTPNFLAAVGLREGGNSTLHQVQLTAAEHVDGHTISEIGRAHV